jgi:hypothetical protein
MYSHTSFRTRPRCDRLTDRTTDSFPPAAVAIAMALSPVSPAAPVAGLLLSVAVASGTLTTRDTTGLPTRRRPPASPDASGRGFGIPAFYMD